jgi:hypothetical protein
VIDEVLQRRAMPVAKAMCNLYRRRMADLHKSTHAEAIAEWQVLQNHVARYRTQITDEVNDALGEWKYLLIEMDTKADFDRYIDVKVGNFITVMEEIGKEELLYACARISGKITDEEHAMSPEEFKAHRTRSGVEAPVGNGDDSLHALK